MKRIRVCLLSLIFVILGAVNCFAENKSYIVKEGDFTIEIPSSYITITPEDYKGSPLFTEYGYDEQDVIELFKQQNIKLNALKEGGSAEITIIINNVDSINDMRELDEKSLGEVRDALLKEYGQYS